LQHRHKNDLKGRLRYGFPPRCVAAFAAHHQPKRKLDILLGDMPLVQLPLNPPLQKLEQLFPLGTVARCRRCTSVIKGKQQPVRTGPNPQ